MKSTSAQIESLYVCTLHFSGVLLVQQHSWTETFKERKDENYLCKKTGLNKMLDFQLLYACLFFNIL